MGRRATKIRWEKPAQTKRDGPCARSGHTLTFVGNSGFLFGGICQDDPQQQQQQAVLKGRALDDLHVLHLGRTTEARWRRIEMPARPLARWRHSACIVNETQIVVFGGHHASNLRLNDVWVLDSVAMEWTQPYLPQAPGFTEDECHPPSTGGVPAARGGHSATVVGRGILVFGGYGGNGYSRRDHDDLHRLDVDDWKWSRLEPTGCGPERRCGHQACAVESRLFVWGGWNVSKRFADVFVLDFSGVLAWSKVGDLREPRWNAASCGVLAIPHWKIFAFGGSRRRRGGPSLVVVDHEDLGVPCDDVSIFDAGTLKWTTPEDVGAEEDAPSARCDSALAFDPKSSKLVLFGGWSNQWLDDLYALDVSLVVGPPYAVTDVHPATGPVTGGTVLEITGYDFVETQDVTVRFASSDRARDVKGTFESKTRLWCETPEFFETPGDVQVRVALDDDSFTSTFRHFAYFSVTDAAWSLIYGPGVLSGGTSGEETVFRVQARDKDNRNRTTGGDEFKVVITHVGGGDDGDDDDIQQIRNFSVNDIGDGAYEVTYVPPEPGEYLIVVEFLGTHRGAKGAVRGSGAVVEFKEFAPRSNNSFAGKLVRQALEKDSSRITALVDEIGSGIHAVSHSDEYTEVQNRNALVWVKEHLNMVFEKRHEIELAMDRVACTLAALEAVGAAAAIGPLRTRLDEQREAWTACQRDAPKIAAAISPLLKAQATRTRGEIDEYQTKARAMLDAARAGPWVAYDVGASRATELLDNAWAGFKAEEKRCEDTARLAKLFGCAEEFKASNELVATAGNTLRAYSDLWKCAAECDAYVREAADMFWDDIEPKGLIENARLVLNKVRSQSKLVKRSDAYAELEKYAYDFLAACPFVASLKQPTIEPRHWRELQEVAEVVATSNHAAPPAPVMTEKTTLGDVLRLELPRHADRVHEIIEKATSEAAQEETLRVISAFWSAAKFVVRKTNHVSTPLLSLTEKDADQLESDQVALQALVASRFDFSKARAAEWQTKLTTVSDALAAIRHVQDVWTYLHPLFGECEEVFNELPEETARFERVEQRVQAILERLAEFGFVVAACTQEDGLADSLSAAARDLDVAHQDLADFLNRKCRSFPRFYFVGERTLVSILSRASNPIAVVEEHVPDLFLATASFRLEDDAADVESRPRAIEFESAIGAECVKFDRAVRLDGKVETYLQTLFNAQASALRKRLQMSLERYPTQTRTQWVQESEAKTKGRFVDPSQIALLVAGANFAGSVEDAINAVASGEHEALQNYAERHDGDLHDLVLIARTSLTPTERQRLSNLICQDAHGRDVLRRLVDDSRTRHKDDFLWQSQLKWRSIEQDTGRPTIKVETCDAAWEYEFEYVGNGSRIVVTPLTEKCFVAIARTLVVNIGCAVMGPACCGKSETIKAMGLAMGKLSYVFGCSPEYDCTSLGRLIKGVAASGAWLLLEDFDRVAPSVLSVCAVHFKAISEGLARLDGDADAKFYISIDGESTVLHHKATTLVTMRAMGADGATPQIQEAVRLLFRPIAILKPDVRLICEVSMMAQGFVAFKPLASKLCGVNCMFEELLPKRRHYDWSLHSLAPILAVAGRTKRMMPEMPEEALVMQVVRDFNRSKFAREDDEIVDEILSNAFPSAQRPPHLSDDALDRLIFRATEEDELWPDDGFRLKVAQLDELLSIRHSVYLVGERGVGKTTIWKTLKHTYAIKDDPPEHHVAVIFPKVFTTKHLYGHIDPRSREWKDGIFAVTLREIIRKLPTTTNWVVLDGEVDPGWTESIESALDETRILPLASNERIRIPQNTRFLFETTDLRFASPAAVSRAAMLYVRADKGKQWQAVTACWVQLRSDEAFSDDNRRSIATMFETYVSPALEFLHSNARGLAVPADDTSLVVRLLVMLEATLTPTALLKESRLETTFVFCCVWAFGSALAVGNDGRDYRKIFSEWWRNTFKQVRMPGKDTVFDYWLEPAKGVFETWRQSPTFSKIDYDSIQMRMDTIMVPTTETASVTFWMDLFLRKCTPLSLVGPSGVGKTLIVTQALRSFEEQQETRHRRVSLNFYSTASSLREEIQSSLHKQTANTIGPPPSTRRLIFFIDDVNLSQADDYDSRSTVELLRHHVERGGWFDPSKLSFVRVVDCCYVTCATNPTLNGGSGVTNARAQRHFATFAIAAPSGVSLLTIFQTFLDGHFRKQAFPMSVSDVAPTVLKATLAVHKECCVAFRKTAANPLFFGFNARHVASVCRGLLLAQPKSGQFDFPEMVIKLWCHEVERAYGDVLTTETDVLKLREIVRSTAKKSFLTINTAELLGDAERDPSDNGDAPSVLCFCHVRDAETLVEPCYGQLEQLTEVRTAITRSLSEYNEGPHPKLDVILFEDALFHIARIMRIILQPAGHALLLGRGGSGRRTLTRLAVRFCHYDLVCPCISNSVNDFKTDLKELFMRSGLKEENVVFLLLDMQVMDDRLLALVDDLLSLGSQVGGLFTKDERESIASMINARGRASDATTETCWPIFLQQVRSHLRVVYIASPFDTRFQSRAKRFPALINCMIIDTFRAWPTQSFLFVAKHRLNFEEEVVSPLLRDAVVNFLPRAHQMAENVFEEYNYKCRRYLVIGPKFYLDMVDSFVDQFKKARATSIEATTIYENGLEKLRDAVTSLATLDHDIRVWKKDADYKQEIAAELGQRVKQDSEILEKEIAVKEAKDAKVATIEADVKRRTEDAEAELALAAPAVDALNSALDMLTREELGECKEMPTLPRGAGDVWSAVCVLLAGINSGVAVQKDGNVRENDRSWDACKRSLLANINGLIEELSHFKSLIDEGRVPRVNFKFVRAFLRLEHFTEEAMESQLPVAACLVRWVRNAVIYFDKWLDVEPKRLKIVQATKRLREAQAALEEQVKLVEKLQSQLDRLKAEFEEAETARAVAAEKATRGQLKLELGQRLIDAVGLECERWESNLQRVVAERELLVGNALLAAAFACYCGALDPLRRQQLVYESWLPYLETAMPNGCGIPVVPHDRQQTVSLLATNSDVVRWQSELLARDPFFLENVAIIEWSTNRWPLLVDPHLHGISWIKKHCPNWRGVRQTICGDDVREARAKLLATVADAVREGATLILETLEEIDAALLPLCRRSVVRKAGKEYVPFTGGEDVEYNASFRLFVQTTLTAPMLPAELQSELMVVEFAVTDCGLEDHLVGFIFRTEDPDLAIRRVGLLAQVCELQLRICEIEDQILDKLNLNDVEPAEDRELIDTLEHLAIERRDAVANVAASQTLADSVRALAERFREVARRGRAMFSLMRRLSCLDGYYVYSLNLFVVLFQLAIDAAFEEEQREKVGASIQSKLKLAAKKAQGMQSFTWNDDILLRALVPKEAHSLRDLQAVVEQVLADRHVLLPLSNTTENTCSSNENSHSQLITKAVLVEQDTIRARIEQMCKSLTEVVYRHMERGVLARDRLTLTTLLAFSLNPGLGSDEISLFVNAQPCRMPDPQQMPAMASEIASWLPAHVWEGVVMLALSAPSVGKLEPLAHLVDEMGHFAAAWCEWYQHEAPERRPLPGKLNIVDEMAQLCVLRVMRPDRLPAALSAYNKRTLGALSRPVDSVDMCAVYAESSASTPILFMPCPCADDPATRVAALGRKFDFGVEQGTLVVIACGRHQDESLAEESIGRMAEIGGWIVLKNVHLTPHWIPTLERKLEIASASASINFRCFLTAEPALLPESLHVKCVKIADQIQQDLDLNVRRAWRCFDQEYVDTCAHPRQFARCLVGLCFFHSLLVCRQRFGVWRHNFPLMVLRRGAQALRAAVSVAPKGDGDKLRIQWDSLTRNVGDVVYSGGVPDYWDHQIITTYLAPLFDNAFLEPNARLVHSDCSAPEITSSYAFIERYLEAESEFAEALGMPELAARDFSTATASRLVEGVSRFIGGGVRVRRDDPRAPAMEIVQSFEENMPHQFPMASVRGKASNVTEDAPEAPYVVVAVRECDRANALVEKLIAGLDIVRKSLSGQIDTTPEMDELAESLAANQVPGSKPFHRISWLAWPTRKTAAAWFADLRMRFDQLGDWEAKFELPLAMWFAFFNAQDFLTAIKLFNARLMVVPLDKMALETHVCASSNTYLLERPTRGVFIRGLFCQGATWAELDSHEYAVDNVQCGGILRDAVAPMDMFPASELPLVYIRAAEAESDWISHAISVVQRDPQLYCCPVYLTRSRGATFVFAATLRIDEPQSKWILRGVALLAERD